MFEIIRIEQKRILNVRILLLFLLIVAVISAFLTYFSVKTYDIRDENGIAMTWQENLKQGKKEMSGLVLNAEYLIRMKEQGFKEQSIHQRNLFEIIRMNYDGKQLEDLTKKELNDFYSRRLSTINLMLIESGKTVYTQAEIEQFMGQARETSELSLEYAEGWKELNGGMGSFTTILLIIIAIILLPLVGNDSGKNMTELYRSTKYGKRQLDHARIAVAFLIGSVLYFLGILIHFVIKMMPFGLDGWNQYIQSNADTFFSLYNITNLQQFLINCGIGFMALLFTISFVLLLTAIVKGIMSSAVVFAFFWILLLLFEQLYLWEVNHFFANFMPLRMTNFSHYYVGNEIYRVFGITLSCMEWSMMIAGGLAISMLLLTIGWERIQRQKGLY